VIGRAYFVPVYCNSLLATLNVRKAIRGRAQGDLGISLPRIGDSSVSTMDNRKVCGLLCHSDPHPTLGLGGSYNGRER